VPKVIDLEESLRIKRLYPHQQTRWGPMSKTLDDMKRYDAILHGAHENTLLIECGTWNGVSARWFAHHPNVDVISIDKQPVPEDQEGDTNDGWITFIEADSALGLAGLDDYCLDLVFGFIAAASAIHVVLDSDHSRDHVAAELEAWAPLVTPGAYLVVEDTITEYMRPKGAGYDGTPFEAVMDWKPHHPEFTFDTGLENRWGTTQCPSGWLLRR
jgi:cephalosporin hydroxylase